ncbi:NADH-quinone oxidoreductase subunit L [Desulfosarcina cetonica]|uniref:NADH-quinone oxidoreductase subunit 5 family protein n=1 Tax=Desulfosarcina cetonica TaxID=90730 RepID=UPI000A540AA8|nr:proton-conducting transporter membrane subunit [Desulfosarcina cetonica]
MTPYLILVLLVLPPVAAVACRWCRSDRLRSGVISVTGLAVAWAALGLSVMPPADVKIGTGAGQVMDGLIQVADIGLLLLFLYYGRRYRSRAVLVLAGVQLLLHLPMELLPPAAAGTTLSVLHDDGLTRVMLLVVNLVGPLICCHALPYMHNHEKHLSPAASTQPRFFFMMLLFLGAMNGLVLANALNHIYFCFELTTLCSFLLIGHDGTDEANQNAVRALWINSIAGVAFALALLLLRFGGIPPVLTGLLAQGAGASSSIFHPAVALLCLAAFVKSAQFPFQRWLLGAMVAPTPVSALLHASTMVKVGVYLLLRLAPLFSGTFMGRCTAIYGALIFMGAAGLAVGQHNGKKILAYSTISNLGLIFACIGLGTPAALTAAVLLMIFHALTKALLFLCVGTIEQHIHSRDIEDMRGLYAVMPATAMMTVAGVLMMIMPPFGMLLGKWMAMEAAARAVDVILLIAAGSALTVIYWARWAGLLMSEPITVPFRVEKMPVATWSALLALCASGPP